MTYGYNKSILELIKTTYNYLFLDYFELKNASVSYELKFKCNKLVSLILKILLNKFNEEFKTLDNLKLIFNTLISLSRYLLIPVYISIDNITGFYQNYLKMEYVSFQK